MFLFSNFISFNYLGEHPAAMQRGAANANIDLSIILYIVTLSLMLQQLNRVTHGYGVSYDVIRWLDLIRPKSWMHCQHQNAIDFTKTNSDDQYVCQMATIAGKRMYSMHNEPERCIMR